VLRVKRLANIQEDIACRAFWTLEVSDAGVKVRWVKGDKKFIISKKVIV